MSGSLILRLCVLVIAALDCAADVSDSSAIHAHYRFSVTDNAAKQRFELTLYSDDDRELCLDSSDWPDEIGRVDWGSHWVRLHSQRTTLLARDSNFGSCEGPSCTFHIAPHGKLFGFISYAEFGDPTKIATLPKKRLEIKVAPRVCGHKGTH